MITVTGAFLAEYAAEVDGRLRVEGGIVNRAEIRDDGKAHVTLVVILQTDLDFVTQGGELNVEKTYPNGGSDSFGLNFPPQERERGEVSFVYFDLHIDAPMEGRYVLRVSGAGGGGGGVLVPVVLYRAAQP
jgi:hypothetical protein